MGLNVQESGIDTLTLGTCILKYGNVFITCFIHYIHAKV